MVAFAAVSGGLILAQILAVLLKWQSPIITASSREFTMAMLVLFAWLCGSSVLYVFSPGQGSHFDRNTNKFTPGSSTICYLRYWFTALPLVAVLSILLQKTDRVNKVLIRVVFLV